MFSQSFSSRIFLAFAVLVAGLLAAAAWFVEARVVAFQELEIERRLEAVAKLLAEESRAVFEGKEDGPVAQARFAAIAASPEVDLRITLIRADGEVVADSAAPPPIASHKERPEFVAAMANGRGKSERSSRTTAEATVYLALRVDRLGQGQGATGPLGVVRVAASLARIQAEASVLRRAFVAGAFAALLFGLLGALLVSRRLARPLEEIAVAAARVARGDERGTIRVHGPAEVRRLAEAINAMAEELRSRVVGIERARAETEAILESLKEGVIAVSDEERLLRMNDAAALLLGLQRPLPPGEALWRAVRFPELESALRRVIGGGEESVVIDVASPLDDGSVLALTVTPLAHRAGAVAILSDVTAIRSLEKVRSDFVANVSHEMRTPLAVIMGALETLTDPTLAEADQKRFLEIAQLNADRMRAIVEDLLELSKIEAEGDDMTLEPLNLEAPVRAAANALELSAANKHILLTVEDPPQTPIVVNGNYKRLEQVFTNLIDNAIKYTPEGGAIRVRVALTERDASVEVEDTGIGIPQHAIARVFERFYRVDKGRSREMGGTGLGLAIVKHATRAHGGRVSVRSEEGRGTTFVITLPRIGAPRPAPQPAAAED